MGVVRFGVSIPEKLIRAFDARIGARGYRTRSEAIRDIIRDYLVEEEWQSAADTVVGTVTVVYDHATRELTHVLTDVQHSQYAQVCCATHVHLDAHNCLEVVVVKGTPAQVQSLANRLIATRGVKHGKLVCTTTGREMA